MAFTCLDLPRLRFRIAVRNLCRLATNQIQLQPHYFLLFPTFAGANTLHLISSASGCGSDCGCGTLRPCCTARSAIPAGMFHAITETTWKLFKNLWTLIHRTMRAGPSPSTRWDLWLAIEALKLSGSFEH